MKKFIAPALILTALTAGVANLPSSYAQTAAPDASRVQTQDHRARNTRLPSERIEARLAYAKTALKITPAQETQWNALASVLRTQAKAMDADVQARRTARDAQSQTQGTQGQRQPSTAIERLEQRQKFLTTAAARTDDVLKAARPLYASFNDDQKKTADDLLSRSGGRHGHRHH
jgi:protein CpxP